MGGFWQTVKQPWRIIRGLYKKIAVKSLPGTDQLDCACPPGDLVILQLAELQIHVRRQKSVDIPHEITIVVPRVEIRRRYTRPDGGDGEEELIYNSVTVVHAPRHGPAGQTPELPETNC